MYGGDRAHFAVCDVKGGRLEPIELLLPGGPHRGLGDRIGQD